VTHCHAVSHVYGLITLVMQSFGSLASLTNVSEKREYTTPLGIQAKNSRKTIGTDDKLDVIKVNELLSYAIM